MTFPAVPRAWIVDSWIYFLAFCVWCPLGINFKQTSRAVRMKACCCSTERLEINQWLQLLLHLITIIALIWFLLSRCPGVTFRTIFLFTHFLEHNISSGISRNKCHMLLFWCWWILKVTNNVPLQSLISRVTGLECFDSEDNRVPQKGVETCRLRTKAKTQIECGVIRVQT